MDLQFVTPEFDLIVSGARLLYCREKANSCSQDQAFEHLEKNTKMKKGKCRFSCCFL